MKVRMVRLGMVALAVLLSSAPAQAHGKKINIDVKSSTPESSKPLTKLYRALLTYDDGDQVTDAKLTLTASRVGENQSINPVDFTRTNEVGVYQANVTYSAYGEWRLLFKVTAPGEGEATLDENLAPPSPAQSDSASARVVVPLAFDTRDALNIVARTVHIFSAISWFSVIWMLFVGPHLLSREAWADVLVRSAKSLPKILGAIWILLIATGIYLAINNAPTRAPGVLAPDILVRVSWGREYLIAFIMKMLMFVGALGVGAGIGMAMRQTSDLTAERVARLAALDLLLGLFIFADVVVIGYLHNLSHLGLLR